MTDKYNAMHERWEADLAQLTGERFAFVRESLERAIKDLDEAKDEEKAG